MKNAFRYSLKHSIPILIGFIPVGLAYGVLMQANGLNWLWTGASSILIFAGSLQFLAVSFFAGGVSLITVAIMALLLNSRHIFYGIPFIEKWKDYGLVPFRTDGIDFALTALFIVILLEQLKSAGGKAEPAVIAAVSSLICLLVFGPSNFILPSLMITVFLLTLLRNKLSPREADQNE